MRSKSHVGTFYGVSQVFCHFFFWIKILRTRDNYGNIFYAGRSWVVARFFRRSDEIWENWIWSNLRNSNSWVIQTFLANGSIKWFDFRVGHTWDHPLSNATGLSWNGSVLAENEWKNELACTVLFRYTTDFANEVGTWLSFACYLGDVNGDEFMT